jgi:hypothetical protein
MDNLEKINKVMLRGLFKIFRVYFELIEQLIQIAYPRFRIKKIVFGEEGVDERIKRIDDAKSNLVEAIEAVDELKREAELNKSDLAEALKTLSELDEKKSALSSELQTLKQIAQSDTDAFRRIVGLPTKSDIWRERIIGFVSGIVASIVTSGLGWLVGTIL